MLLESGILCFKCEKDKIGVVEKVDFILLFYMVHEPPVHVSKKAVESMLDTVKGIGFRIIEKPKIFFGRSVVLTK